MNIEESLKTPLEWFKGLPTWGKWAVAAGGAGALLFVWKPWSKSSSAGSSADNSGVAGSAAVYTAYPDYSSGTGSTWTGSGTVATGQIGGTSTDTTYPVTPITPTTPTTPTTPSTPSVPYVPTDPSQLTQLPTTVPVVPTVPTAPTTPTPAASSGGSSSVIPSGLSAAGTIQAINNYMRQNATVDPSTTAALHQQKVQAAASLGYTVTSDGYVLDPNTQQYAPGIDQTGSESAAAMAIHSINEFVATNYANLTDSQIAQLHAQKVAAASSLGYTVDAGGDILDSSGNLVPGVGWQPTNITDYHTAQTQSVQTPQFYKVQQLGTTPLTPSSFVTPTPGYTVTYNNNGSYTRSDNGETYGPNGTTSANGNIITPQVNADPGAGSRGTMTLTPTGGGSSPQPATQTYWSPQTGTFQYNPNSGIALPNGATRVS